MTLATRMVVLTIAAVLICALGFPLLAEMQHLGGTPGRPALMSSAVHGALAGLAIVVLVAVTILSREFARNADAHE